MMTDKVKTAAKNINRGANSFSLEAYKTGKTARILVCGVIGINDFSDSEILLITHGGRISISGRNLRLVIMENRSVEIQGESEYVRFG